MCDGLPAQQTIPHSCEDARELKGTTPDSMTSSSIVARMIRAIDLRAVHAGSETESKEKAPFRRVACG
jgi:hypothetical protein